MDLGYGRSTFDIRMNVPSSPQQTNREEWERIQTPGTKHQERIHHRLSNLKTATALMITLLISSCVYHRRGASGPHLLEYDHKDAEVVFPWDTSQELREEYELAVLASIIGAFAYPIEALEGLARLKIQKLFYLIPTLFYAIENGDDDIDRAIRNAREMRLEKNAPSGRITAKNVSQQ